MKKIKIFAVLLTVILAILLAVALVIARGAEKDERGDDARLEEAVTPLYTKLSDLDREREALDRLYEQKINGEGTVGLLYIGADLAVYEVAYSQAVEYGYSGIIALSDGSFPGDEGCMDMAQFSEMLAAGWKWCVTFPTGSETPEADVAALLDRAIAAGIGRSNILYFPSGTYTSDYSAWLSEGGFDIVLHQGGRFVGASEDEVWYAETVHWRSDLRRYYLTVAAEKYENILYEISLRSEYLDADTAYHSSILSVLSQYSDRDEIRILTPDEAKEYRLAVEAGQEAASKELQSKKDELDAQMKAIRAEIDEICKAFEAARDN